MGGTFATNHANCHEDMPPCLMRPSASALTCQDECGLRNKVIARGIPLSSNEHFTASYDVDDFEAPIAIPRTKVDFQRLDIVPNGWRICKEQPPEGFLFAGGAACIIEEVQRPTLNRHVLLALPEFAVDMRRAKVLMRVGGQRQGHALWRLWRTNVINMTDQVLFEFDFPSGQPLNIFLERHGYLAEERARRLCKDLMLLVTGLTLGGVIDSSLVYLNKQGLLCSLLPLGALLSPRGLKAVAMSIVEQIDENGVSDTMSPELRNIALGTGTRVNLEERCVTSDSYAVMALVLHATMGTTPKALCEASRASAQNLVVEDVMAKSRPATTSLSSYAKDLFHKSLYEDPTWRLCGQDVLSHPWLAKA